MRTAPPLSAPTEPPLLTQVELKTTAAGERYLIIREAQLAMSAPQRRLIPRAAAWRAAAALPVVMDAAARGLTMNGAARQWLELRTRAPLTDPQRLPQLTSRKGDVLMPFQRQGVAWLFARGGRGILGDEMGLGKTIQALAYLQLLHGTNAAAFPALVICPAFLKLNWRDETLCWSTLRPYILQGKHPSPPPPRANILIINYEILHHWLPLLQPLGLSTIIVDECHRIKNPSIISTRAVLSLTAAAARVIPMSGTPITSRPSEMWTAIHAVDRTFFPSFWNYAKEFCSLRRTHYGYQYKGAVRTARLHDLTAGTVILRRLKADVLKELPAKRYAVVHVPLTNTAEYRAAELLLDEYAGTDGRTGLPGLAAVAALQTIINAGKIDAAGDWIETQLETGPLVVFAIRHAVIDALRARFGKRAVVVDGRVTTPERHRRVASFQSGHASLFIGQLRAAGTGLTLTAASNVAFLEQGWTPGEMTQAADRCHRKGQRDAVTVYYLVAEETIEPMIANMLVKKQQVLDAVLDGKRRGAGADTSPNSMLAAVLAVAGKRHRAAAVSTSAERK